MILITHRLMYASHRFRTVRDTLFLFDLTILFYHMLIYTVEPGSTENLRVVIALGLTSSHLEQRS
nr:hypothetical protein [uncultured bacterium]